MSSDARERLGKQAEIEEFPALADLWYRDTMLLSFTHQITQHPAHQRIIGMGRPALPLILKDLQDHPRLWFVALQTITGENPVPTGANHAEAREAWLQWGRQHDYLA